MVPLPALVQQTFIPINAQARMTLDWKKIQTPIMEAEHEQDYL
jgi:hypothetical protein